MQQTNVYLRASHRVLRILRRWELQPRAAMLKKQQLHIMTTLLFQKRKQMDRPVYDSIGSPLIVLRLSFITPNTPQTVLVYIVWLKKQKQGRSSSKLLYLSALCCAFRWLRLYKLSESGYYWFHLFTLSTLITCKVYLSLIFMSKLFFIKLTVT